MLGALVGLAMTVASIWAAIWTLYTLADLKQGQKLILQRLAELERPRERPAEVPLHNEKLLPRAREE